MNEAEKLGIGAMTEQELKKATRKAVLQVALLYPIACLVCFVLVLAPAIAGRFLGHEWGLVLAVGQFWVFIRIRRTLTGNVSPVMELALLGSFLIPVMHVLGTLRALLG